MGWGWNINDYIQEEFCAKNTMDVLICTVKSCFQLPPQGVEGKAGGEMLFQKCFLLEVV